MKLTYTPKLIEFNFKNSKYRFLNTGNIYSFLNDDIMINGFFGNLPKGSINNIWLRVYKENKIDVYPLLGISSNSTLSKSERSLKFSGNIENISYNVTFYPKDNMWFWKVDLDSPNATVDLLYGQDIGLSTVTGLLENELYSAQYLGNTIFEKNNGYIVCSRQNLPQNDNFPYIQQGMLKGKVVAYSTDAFQFFGKTFKLTEEIEYLYKDLQNENLQFECSYTALQSDKHILKGSESFVFYGITKTNFTEAITTIDFLDEISACYKSLDLNLEYIEIEQIKIKSKYTNILNGKQWNKEEVENHFPNRRLEEILDNKLLSFFDEDNSHFVLQQKELLVERPHANIITTLIDSFEINNNLITTTNYINGIFNSQTVIGNTSMNKLTSSTRSLLDYFKTSGQRILILIDEKYYILNLPSLFEMGLNYSRWYYDIETDIIEITTYAKSDNTEIILELSSKNKIKYDYIVTNQLVMGKHEYLSPIEINNNFSSLEISQPLDIANKSPYPFLNYNISIANNDYLIISDSIFYSDEKSKNDTLVCIDIKNRSDFKLHISGSLTEKKASYITSDFDTEKKVYINFYKKFISHFNAKSIYENIELEKLNTIMFWFTHNALVHYAVPHGIEQSGGAAWGTRDISQGPMELFLSTQNYTLARNVILEIFSHQSEKTGEWPQWFMFDKYPDAMEDCHGDVIFWPLKCVGDYINVTNDFTIFDEYIPFKDTKKNVTLLEHIKNALHSIEGRFLENTHLISYAGGDWDDTLQPASLELKENLVSSWTQALAYQVLSTLSFSLKKIDNPLSIKLNTMSKNIKASFDEYLIIDGVIAGFIYRTSSLEFSPLLHPKDQTTGIKYRLLPMTRSIISNLADVKQATSNFEQIDNNLFCPDGVRLMDKPAKYNGGISELFLRAERAANVGREVSLQYTHAHIRYIEALCHMGYTNRAWSSLFQINPITLKEVVPKSLPRQSNLYFTSSEGAFLDRYDYAKNFHKLKEGTIDVKGGWRLYSSGPGIYIKNVIENIFGIRFNGNYLIIDPMLPASLNGIEVTYNCYNKMCILRYHITTNKKRELSIKLNNQYIHSNLNDNPYRSSGISLDKTLLTNTNEENIIDVYVTTAFE
ncbi:MAG: GH36-type glycosyl hydrolase domain-containing protein [Lachnospirales bacterium]